MHSLSCLPSLVEIELYIAVFTDSLEHGLVYGLQSIGIYKRTKQIVPLKLNADVKNRTPNRTV